MAMAASEKWDGRFLDLATFIAEWSKDPSTKVGAALVRPDRTIAAVGFNGFPRGVLDHVERYEDRPTKYEMVVHAELNALLSSRESLEGYTIYVAPLPPPGTPPEAFLAAVVAARRDRDTARLAREHALRARLTSQR